MGPHFLKVPIFFLPILSFILLEGRPDIRRDKTGWWSRYIPTIRRDTRPPRGSLNESKGGS